MSSREWAGAALLGFIVSLASLDAFGPWALLAGAGASGLLLVGSLFWEGRKTTRGPSHGGASSSGQPGPSGRLSLETIPAEPGKPQVKYVDGWSTRCEPVAASQATAFGRGVLLAISGDEELDLVCIVSHETAGRFECVAGSAFGRGPSRELVAHFPGEFRPRPPDPWPVGYYTVTWIGEAGDVGLPAEAQPLGQRWFRVEPDGTITCS